MSEKRVKQDQSKVEDTLSLNRQSKVEEDFANFIDEARMDALDRIQAIYQSKEKIDVEIYYPRLACLIFEVSTLDALTTHPFPCKCGSINVDPYIKICPFFIMLYIVIAICKTRQLRELRRRRRYS